MKSIRLAAGLVATLLVCGSFTYHSGVSAQTGKHTESLPLAAIKGKRKVFVSATSPADKALISDVLKTNTQLEVVERSEDAEFFIRQTTSWESQLDKPAEISRDLPRLPSAEVPQREAQLRTTKLLEGNRNARVISFIKTGIHVYFLKPDGTEAIVWSKSSNSRVSSRLAVEPGLSAQPVPEPAYNYQPKSRVQKLTERFIKDLNSTRK